MTSVVPAAPSLPQAEAPAGLVHLTPRTDMVVCDDCTAVHARATLQPGQVARCVRCNALLGRGHVVTLNGMLAFALAALLCFIIGNLSPLVTLDLRGVINVSTLPSAIGYTWDAGQPLVALLAALTTIVFPLSVIVLRLYVLVPLVAGRVPAGFVPAMHLLRFVTNWSMVEVFMLGALVAIVRSTMLASVLPGFGLFAYAALTLLLTSIAATGMHTLWAHASALEGE